MISMRNVGRLLALSAVLLGSQASLADECAGFKWDVRREQSLFAGQSVAVNAGDSPANAPKISANTLYALHLAPQTTVVFALAPGKMPPADGSYAGLAVLGLLGLGSGSGRHLRVALDFPIWVDVVANGKLATVVDYQGQRGCNAPHKIVEFDLDGASRVTLQISGAANPAIRLTATEVPASAIRQ